MNIDRKKEISKNLACDILDVIQSRIDLESLDTNFESNGELIDIILNAVLFSMTGYILEVINRNDIIEILLKQPIKDKNFIEFRDNLFKNMENFINNLPKKLSS